MNQTLRLFIVTALQTTVIVCAAVLLLMRWTEQSKDLKGIEVPQIQGVERNERSTPRSFVLPATPGIAFEQERQAVERDTQDKIAKCVGRLKNLGYEVGDGRPRQNVQLVETLYYFQTEHRLPATGRLNPATMRAMRCL